MKPEIVQCLGVTLCQNCGHGIEKKNPDNIINQEGLVPD